MTDTLPTRSTAAARIASGLSKDPREHLGERVARSFRFDAESEKLLALRESRPAAWDALPNGSRVGLALYAGARDAARALGIDTSAPAEQS